MTCFHHQPCCFRSCPGSCPSLPVETNCQTLSACDVIEGDYLDTRRHSGPSGYVRRVFTAPEIRGRHVTLNVEGERPYKCSTSSRVKVWRPVANCADARPIDRRLDRPFRNLSEVYRAGRSGLNAVFPVGSLWEVGPFVEGRDPDVVRVIPRKSDGAWPAFKSGENSSAAPEDAKAKGQPAWFIQCEVVWTCSERKGQTTGHPPCVLAPLTPRMADRLVRQALDRGEDIPEGLSYRVIDGPCGRTVHAVAHPTAATLCCDHSGYVPPCEGRILSCNAGVIVSMRAEAESLRETIQEQQDEVMRLHDRVKALDERALTERTKRRAAEDKLHRARRVLTEKE